MKIFDAFVAECARFELDALLGNPQFLILFGEAFVESGQHFVSKKKIYFDAVRRLAHEANLHLQRSARPPNARIVEIACEVFAKLMLSGSAGISASEKLFAFEYPYLQSLVATEAQNAHYLTDTRLLKPSADPGLHEPTHRIVAEYCAAKYLISRIDNPADRLSLSRVLAIVAPKGVVRTELRGMLGWMAALSLEAVQRQLIELDPYAVIANGDPSEFTTSSKKALLKALNQLAEANPLFRRSDAWRHFNVGAFFTADIKDDIRELLSPAPTKRPLQDLVLELLASSHAADQFSVELRRLALDISPSRDVRVAAYSLLLQETQFDPRPDLPVLLSENSQSSLELGATAVRLFGSAEFEASIVVDLLRNLSELYPKKRDIRVRDRGSRYFIRMLVNSLDQEITVLALNQLTAGLACSCNSMHEFQCTCRVGISKIVGLLLDHHLPAVSNPGSEQIWQWTRALVFKNQRSKDFSPAVRFLFENSELRQEVQRLAVLNSPSGKVQKAINRFFHADIHSGIQFYAGDLISLVEYAFKAGAIDVWSALWVGHNIHDEKSHSNPQRTLMRRQANSDVRFLRVWSKLDRLAKRNDQEQGFRYRSRRKKYERREAEAVEHNRTHLIKNRAQIEAGRHWGWLEIFANQYLFEPEKLNSPDYGDTPQRALRNCIPFLRSHVPTLRDLANRKGNHIAEVLFAHCLVRFRAQEGFHDLEIEILRAAMTETVSYPAIKNEEELEAIQAELYSLVFSEPGSVLKFAREFIEPPLASKIDTTTNVYWLEHYEIFHELRETLPIEWLCRYPEMPMSAQDSLFKMAAKHGDRKQLKSLIDEGFGKPTLIVDNNSPECELSERRHRFWALNAFFFSTNRRSEAIAELRQDPNSILAIAHRADRFRWHDDDCTPSLSAEAIFDILDAFVEAWPKVHLPSSYGSGDPDNETAYRFLRDVVWRIGADTPSRKLPILNRLLQDERFKDFIDALLSLRADAVREVALADFKPPSPQSVSEFLDCKMVASVEDLRALVVEVLNDVQVNLKGLDTDPLDAFYDGGEHVNENTARNRVVDMIRARLTALGIPVVIEHHMAKSNRADFTASASVSGSNPLLVVEAKGQWHAELFTAAAAQLSERYSIHPDASGQGVYLVFWFGNGETVAGKVDVTIATASELRDAILKKMPEGLQKSIDVVVLDLFRPKPAPEPTKGKTARKSRKKNRRELPQPFRQRALIAFRNRTSSVFEMTCAIGLPQCSALT